MAQLIDGKLVSSLKRTSIKEAVYDLKNSGISAGLAVVIVGDDNASKTYVANKKKACLEVGIESFEYTLPEGTTESELLELVGKLNHDSSVNGILVQLPLPRHINEQSIINSINPNKDVDAFHPVNVGKIMTGEYNFLPCTPAGIMELIDHYGIDPSGKHCAVIGRSNIVGKPMSMLMLHRNATVTICHSKTENLSDITKQADILVCAIGKANYINGDMIKDGAVIIDVGMNRDELGKRCGDVDFESVFPKASFITPVPGGVGPMTITMLLENTVRAAKLQNNIAL